MFELPPPDLETFRKAVSDFASLARPDLSWRTFCESTGGRPDLSDDSHRTALLRWLNKWGCRIKYPSVGLPDVFGSGLNDWWAKNATLLPAPEVPLVDLDDPSIERIANAYADLANLPVTSSPRSRTLAPTAAAKTMYALRPLAIMPWDEAIARQLHGSRNRQAFVTHLRMGRDWGRALLKQAQMTEAEFVIAMGRPGMSLAKLLDEYCYVTITRA